MRNFWLVWLLALLSLGLVVSPALAQDDDFDDDDDAIDRTRPGWYLSARGLYAWDFWEVNGVRVFERENVNGTAGIDTRVGYRLGPIFAVEGEFEWLEEYTVKTGVRVGPFGARVRQASNWEMFAAGFNGKAYWPLGPVEPYALIGVDVLHNKQTGPGSRRVHDTGAAFRGGIGADFYGFGSESWAVTTEVDYVAGVGDVDYIHYLVLSAGFTWRW